MELQLDKIIKTGMIVFLLLSCTNERNIKGDWGVVDTEGNYSELYFQDETVRIYTEVAGYIGMQSFKMGKDSLLINNLIYKTNWINPDSLVLACKHITLYLRKINLGFKLSEFSNESLEDSFRIIFYNRMYTRKSGKPQAKKRHNAFPEFKEEIIEIESKTSGQADDIR